MTLQDAQHGEDDIPSVSFPIDFPNQPVRPVDPFATPAGPALEKTSLMISELPTTPIPAFTDLSAEALTASKTSKRIEPEQAVAMAAPADQALPATPAPIISATNEIIAPNQGSAGSPPVMPMPYPAFQPPAPPYRPRRRKRLDTTALVSLGAALLLLVLSAGGLAFELAYYQPYLAHSSATATAHSAPTSTARASQTQIVYSEQTSTAQQEATAAANQAIYNQATSGRPFTNDSLKHQSASGWDENTWSDQSSCAFQHESYEVSMPNSGYFLSCFAENTYFIDFALQVNIRVTQGDSGGIFFRGDSYYMDGYLFEIFQTGEYALYAYSGSGNADQAVMSGETSLYKFDQTNQLTIIATGTTYYFYLNRQFINSVKDKSFGEGQIGLVAYDTMNATTVDYTNFKVWMLP